MVVTLADVAPVLEAGTKFLLEVIGSGPRPVDEVRAIARRHGFSWRDIRSAGHALGVTEIRRLGLFSTAYWVLLRREDGTPCGPDTKIEGLILCRGEVS